MAGFCRKRRVPRVSGAASRKIFTSASGNTLVPMSRPSITMPPPAPIPCWRQTIHSRTGGCTDTLEAASVTSCRRMRSVTSAASSSTWLPSPCGRNSIRDRRASSARASPSSSATCFSIAFSANARYMAPVSILTYPYLLARSAASVLLPEPAGPSIAMMIRRPRCEGLSMVGPARFRRRRKTNQCLHAHSHVAQLAGREQRVKRLAHFRARGQIRKELLDLVLGHSDCGFQILAENRGNAFGRGDVDAFFHRLWRPAIQHVPERSLVLAIIHARDLQDRPQLAESAIQRRTAQLAAHQLTQLAFAQRTFL